MAEKINNRNRGGTYTNMVECPECGFKELVRISRTVAVQNADCPECGEKALERSN